MCEKAKNITDNLEKKGNRNRPTYDSYVYD